MNLASVSAARGGGVFGNALYGTTKAGVVAYTKGFAHELARRSASPSTPSPQQ